MPQGSREKKQEDRHNQTEIIAVDKDEGCVRPGVKGGELRSKAHPAMIHANATIVTLLSGAGLHKLPKHVEINVEIK